MELAPLSSVDGPAHKKTLLIGAKKVVEEKKELLKVPSVGKNAFLMPEKDR